MRPATPPNPETPENDVCECGHWSRHHNVGKRRGCGHCSCQGFAPQPSRYVTSDPVGAASFDPTPIEAEKEDPEQYRLYRLCPCGECGGTGKTGTITETGIKLVRCKDCRGEGRTLELVATCGNPQAVGVALVTLASEGEWDECPFGLMHRPEGQTGKWLLKPWGPSARNVSDAGRTLATARHRDIIGGK